MVEKSDKTTPSQRRRQKERVIRKQTMVDAAETLFEMKGIDQTSMEQIATKAGFTKATLYNYFESKDEIYLSVATKAFRLLCLSLEKGLDQSKPGEEFQTMTHSWLEAVREKPFYADVVDDKRLRYAVQEILKKEGNKQILTQSEMDFRKSQMKSASLLMTGISKILTSTEKNGEVNPEILSLALSAVIPGFIKELITRESLKLQNEEDSANQLSMILNLVIKGIKSEIGNKEQRKSYYQT
jgi:AcrR family transcriptional regulator